MLILLRRWQHFLWHSFLLATVYEYSFIYFLFFIPHSKQLKLSRYDPLYKFTSGPISMDFIWILLNCRMRVKVERVAGSGIGLSSASLPYQSQCCFPSLCCSPSTPSSRQSSYSGAWHQCIQMERIRSIILLTLRNKWKKSINTNYNVVNSVL